MGDFEVATGGGFWVAIRGKALKLLQAALRLHEDPNLRYQLGQIYFGLADYATAIAAYEVAEDGGIQTAQLFGQKGIAFVGLYRQTGDRTFLDKAEAEYKKAAKLDREQLINLANVCAQKGDKDQAIQFLGEFLLEQPEDPHALANLAVYRFGSQPEKLAAQLETLVQLFPDELVIKNILADVYYRAHAWRKALLYYHEVLKPDTPNAYQLEEAYWKAAKCTEWCQPGNKSALLTAGNLVKEGLRRFPESKMLRAALKEVEENIKFGRW